MAKKNKPMEQNNHIWAKVKWTDDNNTNTFFLKSDTDSASHRFQSAHPYLSLSSSDLSSVFSLFTLCINRSTTLHQNWHPVGNQVNVWALKRFKNVNISAPGLTSNQIILTDT